ncbi:MAG: Histidine triad (HIT) protein [Parcubacteria group bacterium GW2011_GWF2_39_8b]|uniref:HIT domain-containing protein n=2 Tax=Candidatus Zambryskiibacteriota TaxID=1817925 RepID=A0A1G2T7G5_9BACT|nr:MAG: Histidine triad (HIT) protein [Parcubacteria group bacterium GW2011_GWF2_39_8b]KKR46176.1 MAG: Histidine triad (HIT) protein [Parcubacteria group bacterium GW2011_GWA2_40_14]OHA93102.1 MAG: hypothetical protein A2W58_03445 [Candidatus Zambryskibacteria bacterium RIFCSPHIGHO2_02_38_10.5]OHA95678.1 MAG: hypothetical protein A3C63_00355 [Candidatus Zambryskibacteria bacterium RIFCSPHIGHO2_02_FULL_39_82]OHA98598.1 MAG: hypothetical protein A3E32_03610 [Candidatus Zambryskibacteria bacterium
MEDCVFCKIIKGEIPTEKVYEDDKCLAFLSINPNNDGHTVLIPKIHYKNYFETPDDVLAYIASQAKKLGPIIQKVVNAEGMNIITNIEKAAGQVVFHTHFHLIPRHIADGHTHWRTNDYDKNLANQTAEKIKSF